MARYFSLAAAVPPVKPRIIAVVHHPLGLQAAHAFTLVGPQIELAMIGSRRKVDILERHTGSMQVDLAADPTQPRADRPIHLYSIGPCFGIVIPYRAPATIVMERATDAGGFRGLGIAMPAQPGQAVTTLQPPFYQRVTLDLPRLEARLGAHDLVEALCGQHDYVTIPHKKQNCYLNPAS